MARKSTAKTPPKRVNRTGNKRSGKTFVDKTVKGGHQHVYTSKSGKKSRVFVADKPKGGSRSTKAKAQKRVSKGSAGGGRFSK